MIEFLENAWTVIVFLIQRILQLKEWYSEQTPFAVAGTFAALTAIILWIIGKARK